jgi:catechol 2,3-dioxygenase-like lactoylglutathione lyase family enzyme
MSRLTWLGVPGVSGSWEACGFAVHDGHFTLDGVVLEVDTEPSWGFDTVRADPGALGVSTITASADMRVPEHPNGVDRIDHVVYAVPELDAAVDALTAVLGEPPRRRSHPRGPEGPEMAFFTVGAGFIEVVSSGRPPALWGIAFSSPDLDATVAAVRAAGGPIGDPKPAVQGGRIASIWKEHVGWGVAVMEPPSRT